jgi:hypothetical protein
MSQPNSRKINLIQIDGKWPNIALMKLSTYHKTLDDSVYLNGVSGDLVYVSCIFTKNRAKALGLAEFHKSLGSSVFVGGSGVDLTASLRVEIENMQPDFDLYGLDYSIGFSSRGCIRNCKPCIVPQKEGYIREVGLDWIKHKKVKLLDNNFLASPKAEEKLKNFVNEDLQVCFTQANDIRLVTPHFADLLAQVNARNNCWKRRCYYFAFDYPELEPIITKKIKLLNKHGIPSYTMLFYVLCGFNTTHEQDMRRIQILHNHNCMAFVMKYHNKSPVLNKFANWCNKRYYKVCNFEDFDKKKWRMMKQNLPQNYTLSH